jgi:hypothetical protein
MFDQISLIFADMTATMAGKVFSLLLIAVVLILFLLAHRDPSSKIDLSDLFVDQSGKIGGSQMRLNLAFALSSWVIIFSTLNGNLSEWLFSAYIAAFVYDRIASRKSSGTKPSVDESQ